MSKIVKSVGKAVKGVVKGVVKVVKGVVKGVGKLVSKIAKSDIGKMLLMAATIYFGGAAIMGAWSGATAAAPGFMSTLSGAVSGAGAGISSAWTGLTSAASAFMGGNVSGAGTALSQGFTGAGAAGQAAVTGVTAGLPAATGAATSFANPGLLQMANVPAAGTAGAAGAAKAGFFADPLVRYGTIQAGSQLVGGMMQGAAADKQYEEQLNQEELARQRVNQNVGTPLWGTQQAQSSAQPTIRDQIEVERLRLEEMLAQNRQHLSGSAQTVRPGLLQSYYA